MRNFQTSIILITLLFSFKLFSQELTKKYSCDSFDYYVTFDTTKISSDEMDELIKYNPDYYSNYSHPISTLAQRQVELKYNDEISFYNYNNPLFIDLLLEELNVEMEIINKVENFKKFELDSLQKEYLFYMKADHWLQSIKYEYLKTNDINKLKSKFYEIDTEKEAIEIIEEIEKESDPSKRIILLEHDFHNKINSCIRKNDMNQDHLRKLWKKFIKKTPIVERKEFFDMD